MLSKNAENITKRYHKKNITFWGDIFLI